MTWLSSKHPEVAYWSVDYDAKPSRWIGEGMHFSDRAINVLAVLQSEGLGHRPIIFLAHSLGGLLVKAMLQEALASENAFSRIGANVKGVVFFATPHSGSGAASFASYLSFFLRPTPVAKGLVAHDATLRALDRWYRGNAPKAGIEHRVFYEAHDTYGIRVVDPTSSDPVLPGVTPIPLDADHLSICKPSTATDPAVLQTEDLLAAVLRNNAPKPSNTDEITILRRALLTARTDAELRRLQYTAEDLLQNSPLDHDARLLLDQIRNARMKYHAQLPVQRRSRRIGRGSSPGSKVYTAMLRRLPYLALVGVLAALALSLKRCSLAERDLTASPEIRHELPTGCLPRAMLR